LCEWVSVGHPNEERRLYRTARQRKSNADPNDDAVPGKLVNRKALDTER
jgi:hypothetical protein